MIEHARCHGNKATLLGDPAGLGKTLPAMMATVMAIPRSTLPSIVVAPGACVYR